MEGELTLTGIVLRDAPVGEYDKRISILTLEKGRVGAYVKGAKRPKGGSFSGISPFIFGKFSVYEGRSGYSLFGSEIKNRFDGVTKDLSNLAYGSYFLEMAEYYSRENSDEAERVRLLYRSLEALSSKKFTTEFIRLVYELKNIAILGEYPNVFGCPSCGEPVTRFILSKRMGCCANCWDKVTTAMELSKACVHTLIFIYHTPAEKLFSFRLSDKVFSELKDFTEGYKSLYFKHKFKTLEMIDMLTN